MFDAVLVIYNLMLMIFPFSDCPAKYEIGRMDVPKSNRESFRLFAICFGKYDHEQGMYYGRQVRGIERRDMAQ